MSIDLKDGGYKSRKMVMAYVVMVLMMAGFFSTARWPTLAVAFAELCFGLLGAASIFAGSTTLSKWAAARAAAPTATKKTALVSETKAVDEPEES